MYTLNTILLYYLILLETIVLVDGNCAWEHPDTTINSLNIVNRTWDIFAHEDNTTLHYVINPCTHLTRQQLEGNPVTTDLSLCYGSYVCVSENNGAATGTGDSITYEPEGNHDFLLNITHSNADYRTIINFRCDKTMGFPIFVKRTGNISFFEWRTTGACSVEEPVHQEVPCVTYTSDGKLINLDPLVKLHGAYSVDGSTGFFINICRGITTETTVIPSGCEGSAACLDGMSVGNPTMGLHNGASGLVLTYIAEQVNEDCTAADGSTIRPSTNVTLSCPRAAKGGLPTLVSTDEKECHHEVIWETEHACPEEDHISKTCQLYLPRLETNIDLSTLHNSPRGQVIDTSDEYQYIINICGQSIDEPCGSSVTNVSDIAGCQKRNDDSSQAHVIGRVSQQTLRYGDNELFLIYDGGDQCSNGQQRTTVIKLHCATEDGSPTYSTEAEHCMYVFDWDTTQACVNATQNDCSVVEDGTRFDLGALMKTKSDALNWDVDTNKENSASSILMNVCSALIRTTRVEQCDAEAAVCYIDEQGHAINIGKYRSNPIYRSDQRVIQITYTDGDICTGTNRAQTVLTLQCVPGEQTSEPVLQFESDDHCLYEIHWRTALACDMGRWEGEDCSVELPSGITFNLEPLRNHDFSLYVNSTQHAYALSVCGPVHSSCGDLQNVGSCQTVTDASVTRYYSTGEANRNLTYTNGMLIMHYKNGSPYSSGELRETDIVFLCDPAAGLGTPQYINENEHTYSFKWYTAYACIEPTVECSAMASDGTRFDLSSLSRSVDSNWNVDGADGTVYHINVCQSLIHTHGTANCHLDSAICSTNRDSSVNLGKSLNRPVVLSPNSVSILYTDGDVCGTGHYSTNITFVCQPGSLNEGPTNDVNSVNECEYSVIWPTEAACSIAHNNSGHCTVKDQNSNYMFDFNPLKRDPSNPYTVNSGAVTFKLNICGAVDGECGTDNSVCLGDSPLGKVSENIEYSDVDISITYKSGSIWSILHFSCELSIIDEPLITFDRKEGNKYLFKVQTALACPPSPVDCVVNNNGVQYDLEALGRDQNWHVPAPNGDMYVINVCKPINSVSANCGGGPIAACKVTDVSEANVNLGYVRTRPTAIENAASILYEGGDNCTTASGNIVSISTQVNMYCHEVESMTFEELVNCVYIFHIYSPAVCPIKRTIGNNCMVTDPVYDVTYDLSPLMSNTGNCGADLPDGDHIDFNICRDVGKSGTCASAGACLTQSNQEINIGVNNSHVTYNDNGAISVTYTNPQACGDNDFTTEIILTCDFEQHHTCANAVTPVGLKRGDCSYAIIMATSHVCHQRPAASSIQSTSGERYDLSQLVRTADNYRTIERSEISGGDATYLINVCTTLVRKEGEMCHPESAACMLKNDRAVNIGSIQEEVLSIDGDNLKLLYTNGDVCSNGEAARTEIILICNKQALASEPHLTGIDSECSYHFVWETVHACKLSDKPVTSSNCTVQNPQTEFVYNLNPLARIGGYSVLDRDHKYNYTFNVCQPLENSPCNDRHDGRSVGICQKNTENGQHYVAGDSSTTLLYTEDSTITLVYSHGERCHHANRERVTLIHFVCGAPGVGHGVPVFVGEEEEQCMYTIEWHTELACERQIDCTVVDSHNHVFDLSPLIYSSGYHEAESDNDNIYYINVCRPVNPIPEVFCPPQAAVCKVNSEHGNPQNIGEAYHSPIVDSSTGLVELRYTTATPCTSNPNAHVSTTIKFTCHRGQEQGVPQLSTDSTDCDYVFSWPTYVVCKGEEKVIKSNCSFTDTRTGINYDLASLAKQDVEVSGYTLRLCGNASACHGAVCQGSRSYGVASTEYIRREGEAVKISYLTTDTCGAGGVYSAHILLQCDDTVSGAGTPKIFYQEDCTVVFTWPTSVVCPPEQCGIRYENEYYDLSKVNQLWEIPVNDHQSYKFRICHGLDHYGFADGCDLDAAVCLVINDDKFVLGRADTQHINVQEDKSLIIQYSGGTAMCSGRAAQVTIELTCGQTGGAPKFYKLDEWTCTYMFKWDTDVVCRKTSVLAKSAESPSTGHSGRTAVIVLSVLSVLMLATVIYVVLRKPQRREHIFGKVKRAFKRKAGYDSVTYSQLYDDTGTEEDGLFMGVNAASNSGSMLGRMSESPFPNYGNDSSDEDLIL